jgi:hypothetical protein
MESIARKKDPRLHLEPTKAQASKVDIYIYIYIYNSFLVIIVWRILTNKHFIIHLIYDLSIYPYIHTTAFAFSAEPEQ